MCGLELEIKLLHRISFLGQFEFRPGMCVKSFDEVLLKRANFLTLTRPNVASKYPLTKFLHSKTKFMRS